MDKPSFYLYIFNPSVRVDNESSDFALMIPTSEFVFGVDKYNVPSGMSTRITYLANNIYSYNIDTNTYTTIKSRGGMSVPDEFHTDFYNIYSGNDVHIFNDSIGSDNPIDDFLHHTKSFYGHWEKKIMKVSLDGLEHPEIYLSSLFDQGT